MIFFLLLKSKRKSIKIHYRNKFNINNCKRYQDISIWERIAQTVCLTSQYQSKVNKYNWQLYKQLVQMNSITNLSDQFNLLLMMNKSFQEILTPGCEFESPSGEVYLIKHYVTKFVCDLLQVGGFFQVLWFPPLIKMTATI